MKRNLTSLMILLLFINLLSACQSHSETKGQVILYTNAQVLDFETRTIRIANIEVTEDKISNIFTKVPDNYLMPDETNVIDKKIIDLKYHYVVPGMIDMHVHSWGNQGPDGNYQLTGVKGAANANLYAGISGFLDLFSAEDYVLDYRNKQLEQTDIEARLFASGPCLTATKGHCSEYGTDTRIINNPEQVYAELASLALKKPDVLKVVYDHSIDLPTIDKVTLQAFINTAQQLGIKSVVHIGTWDDVRDAAKAGASAITHTPMSAMPDDIPAIMLENNVNWIPTLVVQTDWPQFIYESEVLKRSLLVDLTTPDLLAEFPVDLTDKPKLKAYLDKHKQDNVYQSMDDAVEKMADIGVKILVGSDSGNMKSFQGFSFHRELEHLVEAGISPWQVLKGASLNAQDFMHLNWNIKVGHQAEFVVFKDSPVEDIKNTQSIFAIIHKGKLVDRKSLLSRVTPTGWAKLKMYLKLQ